MSRVLSGIPKYYFLEYISKYFQNYFETRPFSFARAFLAKAKIARNIVEM